ncbi:hypothetical protein PR048_019170 [Dryococelus australis]|uniref:Kazal-like domain-containing protein n=1 Tax=Dryococelus australis TaxID=614101 RepID=A0ABQ9H2V4_9NEOP|nr:hypothetical protein PR048_019170 [Dryococelus australis]
MTAYRSRLVAGAGIKDGLAHSGGRCWNQRWPHKAEDIDEGKNHDGGLEKQEREEMSKGKRVIQREIRKIPEEKRKIQDGRHGAAAPKPAVRDPWRAAGWILLTVVLFITGSFIGLFPKTLPDAAVRKMIANEKARRAGEQIHEDDKPSFSDLVAGFKRLLKNKAYMAIQISHIFYIFGYMPYWVFMAKYIEVQFRVSASISSLITGTVGLVFSALGILMSGIVITKFRPKARSLAIWNITVVFISTFGIASYAFIGCTNNDTYGLVDNHGLLQLNLTCNANCTCDHVRYNPVCSQYGDRSFISPCHAGCSGEKAEFNGTMVYTDCSCIAPDSSIPEALDPAGGYVLDGTCPSDCMNTFLIFISIVCLLKFTGATSRSSNFLVSIRCVEERDKTISMGFGMALLSIFTFMPAPIFFGYIIGNSTHMYLDYSHPCDYLRNDSKRPGMCSTSEVSQIITGAATTRLPSRKTGLDSRRGSIHILAFVYRAGLCWLAGFLGDLPFSPPHNSDAAPYSAHFTLIGSQNLGVKSSPILFTHSLTSRIDSSVRIPFIPMLEVFGWFFTCVMWTCWGVLHVFQIDSSVRIPCITNLAAGISFIEVKQVNSEIWCLFADKTCMVWGKSCTGRKGNCWLYNGEAMRTTLNLTAAGFIAVGAIFDVSVWYFVKNVKIFDEEVELKDVVEGEEGPDEQLITEKGMDG